MFGFCVICVKVVQRLISLTWEGGGGALEPPGMISDTVE